MSQSLPQEKKEYTEEERLELAKKLDNDLDAFLASRPRKPYTDGWTEENWQEVYLIFIFLKYFSVFLR